MEPQHPAPIDVMHAVGFRVLTSATPPRGVVVEIIVATHEGEHALPAFWMPKEAALKLAKALEEHAAAVRPDQAN